MNIFVGSLSFKTTEEELRREFETFGKVDSVKIILDHETQKSRGFAFVTMSDQDQATAAIAGLNGKEINGFTLKINEARPRESQGGPGRERSGPPTGDSSRSGSGYGFGGGSAGHSFSRDRFAAPSNDSDIYDTKEGRSGGRGRKGRGGGGSDGRSGRGKRSY